MTRLSELLMLPSGPLVALIGAGGKTTTMFTLATELVEQGRRVVTTTTTAIYVPTSAQSEYVLVEAEFARLLSGLTEAWQQGWRHVTVARARRDPQKLAGLEPEEPRLLFSDGGAEALLVEADGARHRLLKAPGAHEPVIPLGTNVVLLLLSAAVLNQPLAAEIVHRPVEVANVLQMVEGELLTPERVARLLASSEGGLKQVPAEARVYVLVTHADGGQLPLCHQLATQLRATGLFTDVLCSARAGNWQRCLGG